ncbi:hypothetical protein AVEN_26462-1 [Araneus ventricosus]|uniref:Uncharacterized protein n=1 Tax=Araneus ventricosus TaxID=182803 RepID=A0A4Y2X3U7_ARAVE|nr:hypothetical protein AVEN_26462-1 [Araneus ventricosus]
MSHQCSQRYKEWSQFKPTGYKGWSQTMQGISSQNTRNGVNKAPTRIQGNGVTRINAHKIQGMESINAHKIQGMESINAHKIQGMESINAHKIQGMESINAHKIQGMESINAHKIQGIHSTSCRRKKDMTLQNIV